MHSNVNYTNPQMLTEVRSGMGEEETNFSTERAL